MAEPSPGSRQSTVRNFGLAPDGWLYWWSSVFGWMGCPVGKWCGRELDLHVPKRLRGGPRQSTGDSVTERFVVTVTTEGDSPGFDLDDLQDVLSEVDRNPPHAGRITFIGVREAVDGG